MKRAIFAIAAVAGLVVVGIAYGQDLNTLLTYFIQDMRNGTLGTTVTFTSLRLGGSTASFPMLKNASGNIRVRGADDAADASVIASGFQATATMAGPSNIWASFTAPTISSGFGTSPSIVSSNGTTSFRVNVGTGGVATSGVVGLPAATTGWNCQVTDFSNNTVTRETASTTTTVTVTAAAAWAASDILIFNCAAF